MSIKEREELLFQKLREKDPDIVADGVICEQEFLNARYKIVYILKEVNGGKSWDLRDFVYEGGRPQTWDNIARWTEGILSWEKEFPWSEMEIDNEQRRFVDAHGECYTVEINEAVAKNPYDKALFVKNENKISYEDKKYTSRLGVDVSVFQGDIDWEQVKAASYEFAILRIGYRGYGEEGTLNADEKFEQNMENARKAGIDVGVYFFSQAVNEEEAKEEADFVLEHLKGQELQMPVVYDPEHILEDEARTDGVTGEQFTQNAKVFCKEIEEAGYDAMIYSNMLWEAYELDLEKLLDYPVWYADYEELPQTPYRFSMWQYSSTGSVPGIEGNVDLNIQLLKK